jgi:hypothetical protein
MPLPKIGAHNNKDPSSGIVKGGGRVQEIDL